MLVLAVIVLLAGAVGVVAVSESSSKKRGANGRRSVARGMVGVMFDGPVFAADVNLGRQLDAAVADGVESLRFAVNWSALQPYEKLSDVPAAERDQFQDLNRVPQSSSSLTGMSVPQRPVGCHCCRWWSMRRAGTRGNQATRPRRRDQRLRTLRFSLGWSDDMALMARSGRLTQVSRQCRFGCGRYGTSRIS